LASSVAGLGEAFHGGNSVPVPVLVDVADALEVTDDFRTRLGLTATSGERVAGPKDLCIFEIAGLAGA
jgi:hypothetical protein